MASVDSTQKKRNNYKLLVDPELKKGQKKLYRLNGKDVAGFPPAGQPKDPRTQKTVLGVTGSTVDFKVPRFKFDKHWVGDPPERDVFVIGLNEGVKGSLLKEVCTEIATIHGIKFHRHPKTKTFLGAATVSFVRAGCGRLAVNELDGKMVGGCYLRAELDDNGDQLKKYLEPVLRKCGLDKKAKPSKECSKDSGHASSDVEESGTRNNSVSESGHELSESEAEQQASTTPVTPTQRKDSDVFLAPSAKLYPYSSLHVLSSCTPSSFTESSPSVRFSPGLTTPCTPSSLDSGISLRIHQSEAVGKIRSPHLAPVPPPLPPEETAPPLPPQDKVPPLPPLSSAPLPPLSSHSTGEDGIENISSDEEETTTHDHKDKDKPDIDMVSPISVSPPNSPLVNSTSDHTTFNSNFDPSFGLQNLLSNRTLATSQDVLSSPYIAVSPGPTTAYEFEFEEISGDESPVMVYNSSSFELKVESVSDDDDEMEVGGDDMEVCSDDENSTVIEVNVRSVGPRQQLYHPTVPTMMTPRMQPPFPPGPRPPHAFFPQQPPPGAFPPLPFVPPPPHPHSELLPQGILPPLPFDVPPPSNFHPRMPNGYVDYPSPSRFSPGMRNMGKAKRFSNLSPAKNKKEQISQEVLDKAVEQLRVILLNDVQKKLIEAYSYSVLDSFWDKREKEKQIQKSSSDQQPSTSENAEKPTKPVEPYRRMLPGLNLASDGTSEAEGETSLPTPRKKRMMNFKIPLVNRGGQRRDENLPVVTRRRLFSKEEDEVPKRGSGGRSERLYYPDHVSDISSEEDFSSEEEESGSEWEGGSSRGEASPVIFSSDEEEEDDEIRQIFGGSSESESEEDQAKPKPPSRRTSTSGGEEATKPVSLKQKPPIHKKETDMVDEHLLRTSAFVEDLLHLDSKKLEDSKQNLTRVRKTVTKPVPPKPQFKKRSVVSEGEVLVGFVERGLDREDVQMFKFALGRLKSEGIMLTMDTLWAHYPHIPTSAPPAKRRRLDVSEDHVSGCARSEGFYKISAREKVKYLPHHRIKHPTTTPVKKEKASSGRVNRANQRRLASVYSTGDMSSDLAKYNQLKARKKQLKFAKSTIHNWGLFAMEDIAADEMVIEYVGEVVRQAVADERERRYEAAGVGSSYLFRVDHDYIIDATRNGNLARFINHCCDPNCYAKVISFGTQKKIVIYSKRDIKLGEEITYDYKFPIEDDKIPCLCGAPNCRGTLN